MTDDTIPASEGHGAALGGDPVNQPENDESDGAAAALDTGILAEAAD